MIELLERPVSVVDTKPAAASARTDETATPGEYLTFRLGEEEYGIEILRVQEIRSYEKPTRIAEAPDEVLGVVNLRGTIVPIVDMRRRMGCEQARFEASTVVIVVNVGQRVVGCVVDSVSDVVPLAPAQIRPAPEVGGSVDPLVVRGIGCTPAIEPEGRERMLVLLDIARLLAADSEARLGSTG